MFQTEPGLVRYILMFRPSGRPRQRWEDNIRMDLKEMGINTRNWVDSAQNMDIKGPL